MGLYAAEPEPRHHGPDAASRARRSVSGSSADSALHARLALRDVRGRAARSAHGEWRCVPDRAGIPASAAACLAPRAGRAREAVRTIRRAGGRRHRVSDSVPPRSWFLHVPWNGCWGLERSPAPVLLLALRRVLGERANHWRGGRRRGYLSGEDF